GLFRCGNPNAAVIRNDEIVRLQERMDSASGVLLGHFPRQAHEQVEPLFDWHDVQVTLSGPGFQGSVTCMVEGACSRMRCIHCGARIQNHSSPSESGG